MAALRVAPCPLRLLLPPLLMLVPPRAAVQLGGTGFEEPRALDRVCAHEMDPPQAQQLGNRPNCGPVQYRACDRGVAELGFSIFYEPASIAPDQTLAGLKASLQSSSRVFFSERSRERERILGVPGIIYRQWDGVHGHGLKWDGSPTADHWNGIVVGYRQGGLLRLNDISLELLLQDAAEAPDDYEQEAYRELIGFFTPAQTGPHTFKINSRRAMSVLWFGETEAQSYPIATLRVSASNNRGGERDWDDAGRLEGNQAASHVSAPQYLIAGRRYFIRAVANTGDSSAGKHVAIGVEEPDNTQLYPIPVSKGRHTYLHDRGARKRLILSPLSMHV